MKIKELRWIDLDNLRALCIKHDWFTCGDNDEYDELFQMVRKHWDRRESLTPARLLKIAQYIVKYSEPSTYEILGLSGVVFCLSEISHSCFDIEE